MYSEYISGASESQASEQKSSDLWTHSPALTLLSGLWEVAIWPGSICGRAGESQLILLSSLGGGRHFRCVKTCLDPPAPQLAPNLPPAGDLPAQLAHLSIHRLTQETLAQPTSPYQGRSAHIHWNLSPPVLIALQGSWKERGLSFSM